MKYAILDHFPGDFLKKCMLTFKNIFPTLFVLFMSTVDALVQDPLFLHWLFQVTPYGLTVSSLLMLNSHDFQTLMLICLSSLLPYESSLTLDPSHCHTSSPISWTSQVPLPHAPPLLLSFPLPPMPFLFLSIRQTQASALSPAQWPPPVKPLCFFPPLSLPYFILPKTPVSISSIGVYMLSGT